MFNIFMNNISASNTAEKELLSIEENNNDSKNNIESNDYSYINSNEDKTEKMNSVHNQPNKITKNIKTISKTKKYYFCSIKFLLLLLCFFLTINDKNQYALNNYLDKIYGEEDLLKVAKEKERKMFNFFSGKEIENIYNVIEEIKRKKKEIIDENEKIIRDDGKLVLACAYSTDNGYIYPTLVSMTSLVINAGNNTFYNIYVLVSPDFTEYNEKILTSFEKNNTEHCKIHIINMGNKYEGKDTNIRIPTAAYYRLDLHNLLPDVDRIIYMDGDTAVFQDLSELIFLDMKGNYILGFLDSAPNALIKYNIKNAVVLCSGVLLMDLAALRKNNITEKFNEFLETNLGNIEQHDQTTINVVCQGKISTLPPKYGMWNFHNYRDCKYNNYIHPYWIRYNKKELSLAYKYPGILHYVRGKPYYKNFNKCFYDEWWEYARKTDYYEEIYNYSKSTQI